MAAMASTLALPGIASAAPKDDAALAKSIACAYAASVAQHAAGASGNGRSERLISERDGIYLVECKVWVTPPGDSTVLFNDERPPLIYRITVDGNNRFFVVGAEGPDVPPVRPGAPARTV
ncbi:hypothetical protein GCM10009581_41580 [Tsukamurella strandjordii]